MMMIQRHKLIVLIFLLIFCLSGCNTSKRLPYSHKYSYKELSKDDPHNLTYKGHYKVGKNYKIKGLVKKKSNHFKTFLCKQIKYEERHPHRIKANKRRTKRRKNNVPKIRKHAQYPTKPSS